MGARAEEKHSGSCPGDPDHGPRPGFPRLLVPAALWHRSRWEGFDIVRVNDQWRIVFRWEGSEAHQVALTDYH